MTASQCWDKKIFCKFVPWNKILRIVICLLLKINIFSLASFQTNTTKRLVETRHYYYYLSYSYVWNSLGILLLGIYGCQTSQTTFQSPPFPQPWQDSSSCFLTWVLLSVWRIDLLFLQTQLSVLISVTCFFHSSCASFSWTSQKMLSFQIVIYVNSNHSPPIL